MKIKATAKDGCININIPKKSVANVKVLLISTTVLILCGKILWYVIDGQIATPYSFLRLITVIVTSVCSTLVLFWSAITMFEFKRKNVKFIMFVIFAAIINIASFGIQYYVPYGRISEKLPWEHILRLTIIVNFSIFIFTVCTYRFFISKRNNSN